MSRRESCNFNFKLKIHTKQSKVWAYNCTKNIVGLLHSATHHFVEDRLTMLEVPRVSSDPSHGPKGPPLSYIQLKNLPSIPHPKLQRSRKHRKIKWEMKYNKQNMQDVYSEIKINTCRLQFVCDKLWNICYLFLCASGA
jgi:hypothetical protein